MTLANKIATGFVDAGISAYLYWEGFEINQNQSASHLIDTIGNDPEPSGVFYAFSMWSRFIRPGAQRVKTTGSLANVTTAAFQNPDRSVIVVFTNYGSGSQNADVATFALRAGFTQAWLTDNTHKVAPIFVTEDHSLLKVTIPAHTIVTVNFGSE